MHEAASARVENGAAQNTNIAAQNRELRPNVSLSFKTALRFWIWLGFVSFGGPAGQIAVMHRELVERKKWIAETDFLHALNFCLLLPGPEAQQLATFNGWRLHGAAGGIAAGAFFVLPSIFVLLALSYLYAAFGDLPLAATVLNSLKAVVLAIVVEAVFKIGKKTLLGWQQWAIAVAAFAAIYFLRAPFPLIVLGAGLIGFASSKLTIQNSPTERLAAFDWRAAFSRAARVVLICAALWLIPLLLTGFVFGWRALPIKLYLFFTQAAFVTFGGAYAVLVYVNQAAVERFGWITAQQAIDGFALAETTPGPLIMVLQHIGFMAGWNNAPAEFNQTFFAAACALLTTFATFLPAFLLVFAFAPFVERLHSNQKLKAALNQIAAAVVGVIATLALSFGATVIVKNQTLDWFALALSAAALIALLRLKIAVLWLIFAGAVIGLLRASLWF